MVGGTPVARHTLKLGLLLAVALSLSKASSAQRAPAAAATKPAGGEYDLRLNYVRTVGQTYGISSMKAYRREDVVKVPGKADYKTGYSVGVRLDGRVKVLEVDDLGREQKSELTVKTLTMTQTNLSPEGERHEQKEDVLGEGAVVLVEQVDEKTTY